MTPPPGSDEAIAQGCRCPVLDNSHGKGMYGGNLLHPESGLPLYVFVDECPLHGAGDWNDLDP